MARKVQPAQLPLPMISITSSTRRSNPFVTRLRGTMVAEGVFDLERIWKKHRSESVREVFLVKGGDMSQLG